jgi:curli production assembly/transport component CsgF
MKSVTIISAALALFISPASADMLYKPVNPHFGGDPFNASYLQAMATAQNTQKPDPKNATAVTQTTGERFAAQLESRLDSSLASQVAEAIFGENAQPSGSVTFDDQQVSFVNTGTQIQISITDFVTGNVTNIVVPTVTN